MVRDLSSIPFETRWQIATQATSQLLASCEEIFRPALQERFDELDQEIWIHLAEYARQVAVSLQLPVGTGQELAESLRLVNTIFFGPGFKDEIMEVGSDGAVVIVRRCPHLVPGGTGEEIFHRCMAFTLLSQRAMNPAFTSRFVRTMCMGDRQCEIRVEPAKEPEGSSP